MVTPVALSRRRRVLPYAAMLIAAISIQFGAAYAKVLFPVLGPQRTSFLRFALGALLLTQIFKPWKTRVRSGEWLLLFMYSAVLGAMSLCLYLAIQRIPLGLAIALEFTGPLALAVALSRRRIDLAWVTLAILGLALLLPWSEAVTKPLDSLGVTYALVAAGLWAAYSLLGRRIATQHGTHIIVPAMMIAALLLLPLAATQSGAPHYTAHLAVEALVIGVFSSALPLSLELFALSAMPTRVYGTFTSLELALGTLVGLLVLRELPTSQQLLGVAAIIIASIGSAVYSR